MSDQDVVDAMKESMSQVHMREPVDAIITRSRRRRFARLAWGGATAVVAGMAGVALFLSGTTSQAPSDTTGSGAMSGPVVDVRVGFTLTGNTDGTVELTVSRTDLADPKALEQALAKVGVTAKVRVGKDICTDPGAPKGIDNVVKDTHPVVKSAQAGVWVLDPKAMPKGVVLNVSLIPLDGAVAGHVVSFNLVRTDVDPVCRPAKSRK